LLAPRALAHCVPDAFGVAAIGAPVMPSGAMASTIAFMAVGVAASVPISSTTAQGSIAKGQVSG